MEQDPLYLKYQQNIAKSEQQLMEEDARLEQKIVNFINANYFSTFRYFLEKREFAKTELYLKKGGWYMVDPFNPAVKKQVMDRTLEEYPNDEDLAGASWCSYTEIDLDEYKWDFDKIEFVNKADRERLISDIYDNYEWLRMRAIHKYIFDGKVDKSRILTPKDLVQTYGSIYTHLIKDLRKYFGNHVFTYKIDTFLIQYKEHVLKGHDQDALKEIAIQKQQQQINEQLYRVETSGRTEFSIFEACVLVFQKKWVDNYRPWDDSPELNYEVVDDQFVDVKEGRYLKFKFESIEEYFKLVAPDVKEWVIRDLEEVWSSYSGRDYYDSYNADEDFKQGYIMRYFTEENMTKLKEFMALLDPVANERLAHLNDEDYRETVSEWLADEDNEVVESMLDDIKSEYSSEMGYAIENSLKAEVNKEYLECYKKFGIMGKGDVDTWMVDVQRFLVAVVKHKLDRNLTFVEYLKKIIEIEGIELENDIREWEYQAFDDEHFDSSSFEKSVNRAIERAIDKIDDEEKQTQLTAIKDAKAKLTRLGFDFTDYNKTPDGKFMIKVNFVTEEGLFNVSMYDAESGKLISGTMSADGIVRWYTHPSLFPASEILNEQVYDFPYASDKLRYDYLEAATNGEEDETPVEQKDVSAAPDRVVVKKRTGIHYDYYELWSEETIQNLRSKEEYARLPVQQAFKKFMEERFTNICEVLGMKIKKYQFTPIKNYESMDTDYLMRVIIHRRGVSAK